MTIYDNLVYFVKTYFNLPVKTRSLIHLSYHILQVCTCNMWYHNTIIRCFLKKYLLTHGLFQIFCVLQLIMYIWFIGVSHQNINKTKHKKTVYFLPIFIEIKKKCKIYTCTMKSTRSAISVIMFFLSRIYISLLLMNGYKEGIRSWKYTH